MDADRAELVVHIYASTTTITDLIYGRCENPTKNSDKHIATASILRRVMLVRVGADVAVGTLLGFLLVMK